MTKDEALLAVQDIKDHKTDDQVAHGKEISLYRMFIRFIALRDDDLGKIAKVILTTDGIDFCRWYG